MSQPKTQTDLLRDFLLARPRRWCAMPRLAEEIGAFAVHSRVADLRHEGLVVVNKIRVMGGKRWSFYRYLPLTTCDGCGEKTTAPLRIVESAPVVGAALCPTCLTAN
jgi:hypothetical protein